MIEGVAKAFWFVLASAFAIGAWSGTHEYRIQAIDSKIESQGQDLNSVKSDYQKDNRLMIEFMARVDERLKNLEQRIQ